jgi:parallel beta-helix repeat protein
VERELRGARTIGSPNICKAITAANNEIFALSEANSAFRGMACVLTLAVASGDKFIIGHVGDSRLYLFWNGTLTKVTSDHSPVGELEDSGQITEDQAMRHPRRNEVFRDVGSYPHLQDDAGFIEIKSLQFPADGALLLCSDGLTDLVRAADISRILDKYDGDAVRIAQLLVEAANAAGGRDNISVIFVPGPEFLGAESATLAEGRARHATTRMRSGTNSSGGFFRNIFLLLTGMLIGLGIWRLWDFTKKPEPAVVVTVAPHTPREITVDASDPEGIIKALATALPGDTILVPPGEYLGPIVLHDGVNVFAQSSKHVIIHGNPDSSSDGGIGVIARGVKEAHIRGFHILGDKLHPLRTGLLISDSSIEAEDIEIAGAADSGVKVEGDSHPRVMGSSFHNNAGPGVVVHGQSGPHLTGNRIEENGRVLGAPRAGIEIDNEAQPTLLHNEILKNGVPAVFPPALDEEIRAKNTVDVAPGKPAVKPHAPVVNPIKPAVKPPTVSHPTHPVTEA